MKRIIASGNCQAGELKNILLRADIGEEISVKWKKSFENDFFRGDALTDDDYANCDLFLQQVGSWDEQDSRIYLLPKKCNIVRFPAMSLDAIWPLGFKDPRNAKSPVNGMEPYPHGAADRLAFTLMRQGLDEDAVVSRYLSVNVREFSNMDRAAEILHEKALLVDGKADHGMAMQPYIDQHFRDQRLFLTRNHPTGRLMAELLRLVIANSALGTWIRNGAFLVEVTERSHGIGDFEDPIHPQVADAFNLVWASPDLKYAYHHEGKFTFADRLRRYIRFQYNENLLRFRTEMGAGRLGQETMLLALKSITYDPFNWYAHLNLGELYRKLGDKDSAVLAFREAVKLEPSSWAPLHTLAGILLAGKKLEEASKTQLKALINAPDKGSVHYQYGLIQEQMGNVSAARDAFDMACKLEPNNHLLRTAANRMRKAAA